MPDLFIRCPKCYWEPKENSRWICSVCATKWNTFETRGQCPACNKIYEKTTCLGCKQSSLHADFYEEQQTVNDKASFELFGFWKKKNNLPITDMDKEWVDSSLLTLAEMFTPEFFRSLITITPDRQYFNRNFTGIEEDVDFILQTVSSIMNIKLWEIRLMFFSNKPTQISAGITATPSEKLNNRWISKNSELVDKGFGNKEVWIETGQMNDPVGLIATISTELSKYKLQSEYGFEEDLDIMADLTAIVFGFGVFIGNSYFKFTQWQGNSHHGWQMQKRGGLPEPIIAYAMAWLAHYRNEDISWKQHLNRTMKRHFEKSHDWIERNIDTMNGIS